MGLCFSQRSDAQTSAVAKSSAFRFSGSLPRPDYIQRLVERFRQSTSPECMRRVVFNPEDNSDTTGREYVSASCHLPGAYTEFFPCPHCTYKDEEGRPCLVEVFHFPNVHEPSVCATVTFAMPAGGCSVEVEFTKGCPNAPIAVDHSPSAVHIITDVCIEVLRFLPRSELETMLLVSRRWSDLIGGSPGSLRQRRSFIVVINFYGESHGMLSLLFMRKERSKQWRTLRVLPTRGLAQALEVLRLHLQNAFVGCVVPSFLDHIQLTDLPRQMLVDISFPRRVDWLSSLLRSMPLNSEIGEWCVRDRLTGNTIPALASCALEPHMNLGRVQSLALLLHDLDATGAQLTSLLNEPVIRGFSRINIVTQSVGIDTSKLRTILSSWQSRELNVSVLREVDPQDALLTLPAQIIRDFVALRDVNSFVAEFSLHLTKHGNVSFPEMPDIEEATDRRKRFRYHLKGKDTVVRVRVYKNPAARKNLTVVTSDDLRRTVLFFNGNVSLTELKQAFQRPYDFY